MDGNLTKGPILKTLTKLALPIMASSFLGTLYNITDMAWIGLLGSKAVAGVGVGGMFTWLSQGLASMARMGGQVKVAQSLGRGEKEKAHGFAQTAVQLSTFMGLAYAILCLIFVRQMVGFFKLNDPEAVSAALSYTKIACGLIVFSFLTVTLTGIYTAQGDSKTPFLANLVGLVTNMILDPVLILGPGPFPKLGVTGAAIATVTAQFIVMSIMIICVIKQKKENVLKGTHLLAKIPAPYLNGICRIGIPTAIQGMAYCIISMVLTRMVSAFGAEAVATQRVGGQIESVSWNTADGFASALNSFTAQNYGAGKYSRMKRSVTVCLLMDLAASLLVSLILIFFGNYLFRLFTQDAGVIKVGMEIISLLAPSYVLFIFIEIFSSALRGIGDVMIPMLMTCGGVCVLRILWIFFVVPHFSGIQIILMCYPISWGVTSILFIIYYYIRQKQFFSTHKEE